MSEDFDDIPRRGAAILVITVLVISTSVIAVVWPKALDPAELSARVAVIDSGIDYDPLISSRMVAEKSFIHEEYGYRANDTSTTDSHPLGNRHGTVVAQIIADNAPNVAFVNAKVVNEDNLATISGITSAIYWAVEEAHCNVINLSLGGAPTNLDILEDAVRWAFSNGVSIVAAAGNDKEPRLTGTSIESPAVYPEVIAVAAVNEFGSPFSFSANGPLRNRTVKPDLSAPGWYVSNGGSVSHLGTSFAAPHVAAAAANIVVRCTEAGWHWTPGMIKALLMASARHLDAESWEVGAGLIDQEAALQYLENVPKHDHLPLVIFAFPQSAPYSFERWFVNSTATIEVSVFMSSNSSISLIIDGSASPWVRGPQFIEINQVGSFDINIRVVSDTERIGMRSLITLIAEDYLFTRVQLEFDVQVSIARIALDISHSPWWLDSIYGQFKRFYEELTQMNIAVEEFRLPADITLNRLRQYDAVLILDPCARDYDLYGRGKNKSYPYSPDEIDAYRNYWQIGGNIMVVALDNRTIEIASVNNLISWFNVSMNFDRIPGVQITIDGKPTTKIITGLANHPIAAGVSTFDYIGCSLNYSGDSYCIAWTLDEIEGTVFNKTVLVGLEGAIGNRFLVTGSNYFIDNAGMYGLYSSDYNARLARQCVLWLISNIQFL